MRCHLRLDWAHQWPYQGVLPPHAISFRITFSPCFSVRGKHFGRVVSPIRYSCVNFVTVLYRDVSEMFLSLSFVIVIVGRLSDFNDYQVVHQQEWLCVLSRLAVCTPLHDQARSALASWERASTVYDRFGHSCRRLCRCELQYQFLKVFLNSRS